MTDRHAVLRALRGFDVVFNCAVIGVDRAEEDPERARWVIVDGAANVAAAAPIAVLSPAHVAPSMSEEISRTRLKPP